LVYRKARLQDKEGRKKEGNFFVAQGREEKNVGELCRTKKRGRRKTPKVSKRGKG